MNLYFADRLLNIEGMASTSIGALYQIINDELKDEIGTGVKTLSFNIRYRYSADIAKLKAMLTEGNYILYDGLIGQTCFTAIEVEHNPIEQNFYVYAEDAGLDLINEVVGAYPGPTPAEGPQPITYYIVNRTLSYDSDWEIGINEIPSDPTDSNVVTRFISWDNESTVTERLASIALYFDAEISYRFAFSGLSITKKYIDIYKKRGKNIGLELRLGREIENVIEKRSIANLATALNPVGDSIEIDGEDRGPITLYGFTYDDGDFYVDGYLLKSRVALERWGRYKKTYGINSDHIVRSFSYSTTSVAVLLERAIAELKKRREPEVTYDVSLLYLPDNLSIGDTVSIVDDTSGLYLSARMLSITICEADGTKTAEFGDYVVKSAGISDRLIELANSLKANFKPNYTWIVYADDLSGTGISLDPTNKKYIGVAENKITETPILTNPLLYKWSKIEGEDGEDGSPGTDGFSPVITITETETEYGGALYEMEITDAVGSQTIEFGDGAPGEDGEDGFSPIVTVEKEGTTTTISVTDQEGTTTAQIEDGDTQHFFVDQNGAHITLTEDDGDDGRNLLMTNDGVFIRDDTDVIAEFKSDRIRMGEQTGAHVDITPAKTIFANGNGLTIGQIINAGNNVVREVSLSSTIPWPSQIVDGVVRQGTQITFSFLLMDEDMYFGGDYILQFDLFNLIERMGIESYAPEFTFTSDVQSGVYDQNNSFSASIVIDSIVFNGELFERSVAITLVAETNMYMYPMGVSDILRYSYTYLRTIPASNYEFGTKNSEADDGLLSFGSGDNFSATGDYSAAFGKDTVSEGEASVAQNTGTIALGDNQTVLGRYNVPDQNDEYAVIIGNGTGDGRRSNLLTVGWTGEVEINGKTISQIIESVVGYRVIDYTYTYSINANSNINITASQLQISTPDGYSPVSVLAARSGDGRVVVRTFNGAATSSAQALCLRNVSVDNLTNLEAHIAILYFSTSLSGGGGSGGGGGGIGTLNYNDLLNKPQLDEVTLQGNRDLYITNTEIDNLINLTIPGF